MKRSLIAVSVLVVCSIALLAQTPAQENQPLGSGLWKLNLEKSTYDPGPRPKPPVSETRLYRLRPDGFWVMNIFGVNAQGYPTFSQTVFKLDGQDRVSSYNAALLADFQATGTRPTAMSNQKSIDPNTVQVVNKGPDGRVVSTVTRTISKDGKTFTLTTKATNAQGQPVNNVQVFERIGN